MLSRDWTTLKCKDTCYPLAFLSNTCIKMLTGLSTNYFLNIGAVPTSNYLL